MNEEKSRRSNAQYSSGFRIIATSFVNPLEEILDNLLVDLFQWRVSGRRSLVTRLHLTNRVEQELHEAPIGQSLVHQILDRRLHFRELFSLPVFIDYETLLEFLFEQSVHIFRTSRPSFPIPRLALFELGVTRRLSETDLITITSFIHRHDHPPAPALRFR